MHGAALRSRCQTPVSGSLAAHDSDVVDSMFVRMLCNLSTGLLVLLSRFCVSIEKCLPPTHHVPEGKYSLDFKYVCG